MTRTTLHGPLATALMLAACSDPSPQTPPTGPGSSTTATTAESSTTDLPTGTAGTADTTADTTATADTTTGPAALLCNGHAALCERPFDQVVFPGTHNSHSAVDAGFPMLNANQLGDIAQQLEDGVRVMLIDLYPDEADPDVVLMCHGPCSLASTPHLDGLGAITDFLVAHPREVLTLIYEDHVAVAEIQEDFAATGADALTFVHAAGDPWPTLGEMIDADTRLVVTAESGGPPPPWFHHVWDVAWDTPYGPMQAEDLSCDLNRGSADNDLFLLNHWVNNAFDLPSIDAAEVVNAADVLQARAMECWQQWDHPPNFVVVDFYERGDLFAVVDALNGV
ncbi:MAG: hypothetical protein KDK70_27845 [Myxococcales bacterium]|nr:hypothetical protein [Myxococcales bacterium]